MHHFHLQRGMLEGEASLEQPLSRGSSRRELPAGRAANLPHRRFCRLFLRSCHVETLPKVLDPIKCFLAWSPECLTSPDELRDDGRVKVRTDDPHPARTMSA
jgi:hypothetical protein